MLLYIDWFYTLSSNPRQKVYAKKIKACSRVHIKVVLFNTKRTAKQNNNQMKSMLPCPRATGNGTLSHDVGLHHNMYYRM